MRWKIACFSFGFLLLGLLLLPFLEVVLLDAEDLHPPFDEDIEFISVIPLMEDKLGSRHVLVVELAADLSQMLDVDVSLLKELIFLDKRNQVVQVPFVSVLRVLFQNGYHHL